jgi:hypothetical protein
VQFSDVVYRGRLNFDRPDFLSCHLAFDWLSQALLIAYNQAA